MPLSNRLSIALLVILLGWGQLSWGTVIARFDPAADTQMVGSSFTIDIVADIPETEPVLGWGLDLTIDDPAIISQVGSPVIGPLWYATYAPDGDELAALAFPDNVWGDDVLLATITFSADVIGQTDLILSVTDGDLTEGFPLDPTGFAEVTFEPGHVTVIPEPLAVILLAMMLGLLAIRRRWHRPS